MLEKKLEKLETVEEPPKAAPVVDVRKTGGRKKTKKELEVEAELKLQKE